MLDKKIIYITDILGATDTEIARRGGLAKESLSRMRSGTRLLKKSSKQMTHLIDGLYSYSFDSGLMKRLCIATECTGQTEEEIKKGLLDWFFNDVTPPDAGPEKLKKRRASRRSDTPGDESDHFGNKLKMLMRTAGVSNVEVSEMTGISPYYISHIRNVPRAPKSGSNTTEKVCGAVAEMILEHNTLEDVSDLIGFEASSLAEKDLPEIIKKWLCGCEETETSDAVHANAFIERMKMLSTAAVTGAPDLPAADIAVTENKDLYTGNAGLRAAVIRFLNDCINNGEKEIFLYSDQAMDWITEEFAPSWLALMNKCLKAGTKIKMIHNIERNSTEMFEAINSWLPLYMSGSIDPYYCSRKVGERFANTIFLSSGSCVRGICVRGTEDRCRFEYHTRKEALESDRLLFDDLLGSSLPLLTYSSDPTHLSGNFRIHISGDIEICIGKDCVIVNKLSQPFASFTLRHPLMLKAFREFAYEK